MNFKNFNEFFPNSIKKELKKTNHIYREGDIPNGIYYIQSGLIGLYHLSETGKETFLRVFGPGSILGHRTYFAMEKYHATSIAITNAQVIFISKEEIEQHLIDHPKTLRLILSQVAQDLRHAELRMSGRHDKSAASRIIESVVFLKLHYPGQVWTRKQIADYSGSTFETVTRILNRLEKEGYIHKEGRDFSINSVEQLLENSSKY